MSNYDKWLEKEKMIMQKIEKEMMKVECPECKRIHECTEDTIFYLCDCGRKLKREDLNNSKN